MYIYICICKIVDVHFLFLVYTCYCIFIYFSRYIYLSLHHTNAFTKTFMVIFMIYSTLARSLRSQSLYRAEEGSQRS